MRRCALVGLAVLALAACGKPPAAAETKAAGGNAPTAAALSPVASPAPDKALQHALGCAAAGVAQQQALLAAAAKVGKSQMVAAMTGAMWAKTVGDLTQSRGGSQADGQAAVSRAIDKASQDAGAGKPDLDEAALEDCVRTATL